MRIDENLSRAVFPDQSPQIVAECSCPQRVVSRKASSVTFHQLDHREEYFPMVARTDARAFFGLPPKALRPSPPTSNNPETAIGRSTFNLPTGPSLSVSCHSKTEGLDTTSDLLPASVSSSASDTPRAGSPMDTASVHRKSIGPTLGTTLGGKSSARLSIEDEMIHLKVGIYFVF